MRFPLFAKVAALVVVVVILGSALGAVRGIVAEREGRLREAERSVADSLATAQSIVGPVLQRSCVERWSSFQGEGKDRKLVAQQRSFSLYAVPQALQVRTDAVAEARYRGIFKVNGYVARTSLNAQWTDFASLQPAQVQEASEVSCLAPVIWVAVSDPRGVREARISVENAELKVLPASTSPAAPLGFHAPLPPDIKLSGGQLSASIELELAGTGSLAFAPVGESTRVDLHSDWPHPSFIGRFLPITRQVTAEGFDAGWQVNALASQAPRQLQNGHVHCHDGSPPSRGAASRECIETFGVSFFDPVNVYVLSERATKYGLLFIALTFAAVALLEVLRQLRVHPIQYFLVGAALALFFLLLVSLSEHLPFAGAYLAASGACTALLAYYAVHVLRGVRAGMLFGAGIGLLYAVLYVLLLLEQTALVLGSVLLFVALAVIMVATRQIDWYAVIAQVRKGSRATG